MIFIYGNMYSQTSDLLIYVIIRYRSNAWMGTPLRETSNM